MPTNARSPSGRGRVRLIGGAWRGRIIEFAPLPGLRPTPDRVRETLFNWLQAHIEESHCLDLFAGSGALSLEALSRGASSVTAIEQSAPALRDIGRNLARLGGGNAELIHSETLAWLTAASGRRYDIVFVDPPFSCNLASICMQRLVDSSLLAARAWIYVEMPAMAAPPPIPATWVLFREKRAGDVAYRLFLKG